MAQAPMTHSRMTLTLLTLLFLQGCAAVAIVDTAVGVATTVVETGVDVTAGVVTGAVDLVTDDEDD